MSVRLGSNHLIICAKEILRVYRAHMGALIHILIAKSPVLKQYSALLFI